MVIYSTQFRVIGLYTSIAISRLLGAYNGYISRPAHALWFQPSLNDNPGSLRGISRLYIFYYLFLFFCTCLGRVLRWRTVGRTAGACSLELRGKTYRGRPHWVSSVGSNGTAGRRRVYVHLCSSGPGLYISGRIPADDRYGVVVFYTIHAPSPLPSLLTFFHAPGTPWAWKYKYLPMSEL